MRGVRGGEVRGSAGIDQCVSIHPPVTKRGEENDESRMTRRGE